MRAAAAKILIIIFLAFTIIFNYSLLFPNSYGSKHSNIEPIYVLIFTVIWIIILVIIIIYLLKHSDNDYTNTISALLKEKKKIPFDINKINTIIPDFNSKDYENTTYELFKQIQEAWTNFDDINLRNLLTDEVYNMYLDQLNLLKENNKQNIIKISKLVNFEITGMESNNTDISITANYKVLCLDYIIDTKNNAVLNGNETKELTSFYQLTFSRSIITDNNNFCPNCGAPVSDKASRKCNYCNSIIVSNNHDWVLSQKKEVNKKF